MTLVGANLSGADLSEADLTGADFQDANLSGANLSGADISSANFSGTNLSEANLSGIDLTFVHLSGAHLDSGTRDAIREQRVVYERQQKERKRELAREHGFFIEGVGVFGRLGFFVGLAFGVLGLYYALTGPERPEQGFRIIGLVIVPVMFGFVGMGIGWLLDKAVDALKQK